MQNKDATDTRKKFKMDGVVFPTPLYAYQAVGVWEMIKREYMALHDQQGMGKAIQALYASHALIKRGEVDAGLITCPSYLVDTWRDQIREHLPASTRVQVLAHKPREKRAWFKSVDYYIINYELFGRTQVTWDSIRGLDYDAAWRMMRARRLAMICDESQYIANIEANTTQAICSLGSRAARRYTLTGTPVAEGPENIWSQALFLDGGALLGTSFPEFVRRYCITRQIKMRDAVVTKITGYRRLKELHRKVDSISLRRTKEQYQKQLPQKLPRPMHPHPAPAQERLLKSIAARLLSALEDGFIHGDSKRVGEAAAIRQEYQRAAAIPELVDSSVKANAKLMLLEEYLKNYDGQCVVWVFHRDVGELLYARMQSRGYDVALVLGGMQKSTKRDILNDFAAGGTRNLIASVSALSAGENRLRSAAYAFYYELAESLLLWRQSQDRLHRIGSKGQTTGAHAGMVVLDVPLLHKSMDSYVWDHILKKGGNADIVTTGKRARDVARLDVRSMIKYLRTVLE